MNTLFQILGDLLEEFAENPVGFIIGIVIVVVLTPPALAAIGKLFISAAQAF